MFFNTKRAFAFVAKALFLFQKDLLDLYKFYLKDEGLSFNRKICHDIYGMTIFLPWNHIRHRQ